MPCNTDHMEPTVAERQRREAAQLAKFVFEARGLQVPANIVSAAENTYGTGGDQAVVALCAMLDDLEKNEADLFEQVVYDARSPMSRRIANWWEEHKAEDQKREEIERTEAVCGKIKPAYPVFHSNGVFVGIASDEGEASRVASEIGGAYQKPGEIVVPAK